MKVAHLRAVAVSPIESLIPGRFGDPAPAPIAIHTPITFLFVAPVGVEAGGIVAAVRVEAPSSRASGSGGGQRADQSWVLF